MRTATRAGIILITALSLTAGIVNGVAQADHLQVTPLQVCLTPPSPDVPVGGGCSSPIAPPPTLCVEPIGCKDWTHPDLPLEPPGIPQDTGFLCEVVEPVTGSLVLPPPEQAGGCPIVAPVTVYPVCPVLSPAFDIVASCGPAPQPSIDVCVEALPPIVIDADATQGLIPDPVTVDVCE